MLSPLSSCPKPGYGGHGVASKLPPASTVRVPPIETGVNPAGGSPPVPYGKTASSRRFGRIDATEPKRFASETQFSEIFLLRQQNAALHSPGSGEAVAEGWICAGLSPNRNQNTLPRCGSTHPAPRGRPGRSPAARAPVPSRCRAGCRGFGGSTRGGCRTGRTGCQ
jgi:hypothetical protein